MKANTCLLQRFKGYHFVNSETEKQVDLPACTHQVRSKSEIRILKFLVSNVVLYCLLNRQKLYFKITATRIDQENTQCRVLFCFFCK